MTTLAFIITRFMEPWNRIEELILHHIVPSIREGYSYQIVIYNRGDEAPKEVKDLIHCTIYDCENVGREAYPIFHFLYEHYDTLPDIIVFFPAHWWEFRYGSVRTILHSMYQRTYSPPAGAHITWAREKDFQIDAWGGSTVNAAEVAKQTYTLARIRPYGEWFAQRIRTAEDVPIPHKGYMTFAGVFSVHRESVLRYRRDQYESWMTELKEDGPNPEIGHYWERSYYTLFA